ncbi:MAG: hypothetical protein P1V97_36250, partial [Planctomycetota bacterium]|nr:hypothetical protein [Planctomycetota bacterium]
IMTTSIGNLFEFLVLLSGLNSDSQSKFRTGSLMKMNKLLSVLSLAAFVALPLQSHAQDIPTVTMKQTVPAVGSKWTVKDTLDIKMDIEVAMNGKTVQSMKQKSKESKEWTIEVLAVSKTQVTKIKVAFKDVVENETGPDGAQKSVSPISNKTLIVEKTDDKAKVTDEAGKAVSDEIAAAASAEVDDVFKEDQGNVQKLLPKRALKLGETFKVKPEAAKEFFGDSDMKDAKLTLTLKETRIVDKVLCAVFVIAMEGGSGPKEVPQMSMKATGELILEVATSWPRKMTMAGPMTMKGTEKQADGSVISFKGAGSIAGNKTAVHSKK